MRPFAIRETFNSTETRHTSPFLTTAYASQSRCLCTNIDDSPQVTFTEPAEDAESLGSEEGEIRNGASASLHDLPEGERMVKELQSVSRGIDEAIQESTIRLFTGGKELKEGDGIMQLAEAEGDVGDDDAVDEEEDDDEEDDSHGNSDEDDAVEDDEEDAEREAMRWKDNLLQRFSRGKSLMDIVYEEDAVNSNQPSGISCLALLPLCPCWK